MNFRNATLKIWMRLPLFSKEFCVFAKIAEAVMKDSARDAGQIQRLHSLAFHESQ